MPSRFNALYCRYLFALVAGTAAAAGGAVELGDVKVRSFIGQPLIADIELTGFSGRQGAVAVKLARAEVFEGAGIALHPALAHARMSVMQRDGRQFLHLTSTRPVDTPSLHLFLELTDAGQKDIRAASLWLAPDPAPPAPVIEPAPPRAAARPAEAFAAPTLKAATAHVALQRTSSAPATAPESAAAIAPAAAPVPRPVAVKAVAPALRPVAIKAAAPVRAPAVVPAAAAAVCPKPGLASEQARACAASEYRSAMLAAQIVELEEKVSGLQAALDGTTSPVAAARPVKVVSRMVPASTAAPRPAPVEPKAPAGPAEGGAFWIWVGSAIVALAAGSGAILAFRRRRAPAVPASLPRKVSGPLLARLREALHRDKRPAPPDAGGQAEPVNR